MAKKNCSPVEVSLKSFFLGPQAENGRWLREQIDTLLDEWFTWRRQCFPEDGRAISTSDKEVREFVDRQNQIGKCLYEITKRFEDEFPKFAPRYIGHMFSEISLPAFLGHFLTLMHNPNNISRESSAVGSALENEAVALLGKMFGYARSFGHFTSGGTVANFEALIRARARCQLWFSAAAAARKKGLLNLSLAECFHIGWQRFDELSSKLSSSELSRYSFEKQNPFELAAEVDALFGGRFRGPVLLVPSHAHYSWKKGARILGFGEEVVRYLELDANGKLEVNSLRNGIESALSEGRFVAAVVSVAGSTECGSIDKIDAVQAVLDEYKKKGIHIWHHIDAAYGGFFCSLLEDASVASSHLSKDVVEGLTAVRFSTSITVDPHKLGYVPYSSGSFLCQDIRDYAVVQTSAPYIKYEESDPGQFTMEGSRSASGAVATLMAAKTMGLGSEGYGRLLARTIRQRVKLQKIIESEFPNAFIPPSCETNIVCVCFPRKGESVAQLNARTYALYSHFASAKEPRFFVSKTTLLFSSYTVLLEDFRNTYGVNVDDAEGVALLRLCLMNPFLDSLEMDADLMHEFVDVLKKLNP